MNDRSIAYFSMEIVPDPAMPTYSGAKPSCATLRTSTPGGWLGNTSRKPTPDRLRAFGPGDRHKH